MNGHMDDLFDSPELLAIVEVDQADRVVCQAPGCGHSVYKRIHVVRQYGHASVYGSDCFARLFADIVRAGHPRYGSAEARLLTAEERALLAQNTERLLAQFETERVEVLEQQRLLREHEESIRRAEAERAQQARRAAELRRPPSAAEIASVEPEAKRIVRERFQVDPDQPGWRGLVLVEARKLLGR
jgi:hypothetical protein